MPINRWMDKEDVVQIYNGILLSLNKEWNNAICSSMMDLDHHTKWSQSDRERQTSYDITYMWNQKKWYKWTYLQNTNRLTDIENKQWLPKGRGGRRRINDEFGINRYTLLYIK